MGNTITVRLEPELAEWLKRAARESGLSQGRIVRDQLRKARESGQDPKLFMSLAGVVNGPKGLSRRKGFSRK
jgi:hypothetical protein